MIDRRTGGERRVSPRYNVNIEIDWEADAGRQKGTVNDISREGCFVLCSGEVEDGDRVKLFFPLSDGMKVQLLGTVVNHIYEIGFGVRYIEMSVAQKGFLSKLIDTLR
ncbi:MAG: PilZ domain-containing protein [Acidobacteria bacterium]|nr:PilZ domain-containing protein [Acidobacteriota bacterium]